MEDNIIDNVISEMNLHDFTTIYFKKIAENLKVSIREVINSVDLSEAKGLLEFSGNTHTSAKLTLFGSEIVKNGGWLKHIENEKSKFDFVTEKECIEFEKSKIDLALSKKMLKEYPYTKWLARIGAFIGIVLGLKELGILLKKWLLL